MAGLRPSVGLIRSCYTALVSPLARGMLPSGAMTISSATRKSSRGTTHGRGGRSRAHRAPGARRTRHATSRGHAKPGAKKWSQRVTQSSNALDLERGVFTLPTPTAVAESLKRSALRSRRRKAPAYQSAMSMLTFYINRAGKNLGPTRRRVLTRAKAELGRAFGRTRRSGRART